MSRKNNEFCSISQIEVWLINNNNRTPSLIRAFELMNVKYLLVLRFKNTHETLFVKTSQVSRSKVRTPSSGINKCTKQNYLFSTD